MNLMDTDLAENDVYMDIRAFFEQIAVLREPYQRALRAIVEPPAITQHLAALKLENGFPIIERQDLKPDLALLKAYFLDLLNLVETQKPLEAQAIRVQATQDVCFEQWLRQALDQPSGLVGQPELLRFLLQETIHPLLEIHAEALRPLLDFGQWSWSYCPVCGAIATLGVLDAETRSKHLVCGACATRWPFARHRCCECGATGHVAYFSVKDDQRFRIETCTACKSYLKVMDLRHGSLSGPAMRVDLTTLHLDIIAQEKGFSRRAG